MKDKITNAKSDAKTVWTSLTHLVEALSLIAASGTTIYFALNHMQDNTWGQVLVLFPGAVIALRGAVEFLKYLARKDK